MQIAFTTLTPIWTGGVDGRSNRLQETGIIGSLRWWYEAIVHGLGGYVSDCTADDPDKRTAFDGDAYNEALRAGRSRDDALSEGLRSLGAVEYLFGATGWKRLFRLQAASAPRVPLHFRSTVYANRSWLGLLFENEDRGYTLKDQEVLFSDDEPILLEIALRRQDENYAAEQLALLFRFIETYGGLGAKLQHGFGQIADLVLPEDMTQTTIVEGLQALSSKLDEGVLRRADRPADIPYNLQCFFHHRYPLSHASVAPFKMAEAHVGSPEMKDEERYLPCAFDLRYRGGEDTDIGFRRWLRDKKDWDESDSPPPLGRLDRLMGPRSQWKAFGRTHQISDELRTASRVYFGMPVKKDESYQVSIFGFAPPGVVSVDRLSSLCCEYMRDALHTEPTEQTLGKTLIAHATGGAS